MADDGLTREQKLEIHLKYPCGLCLATISGRCKKCRDRIDELSRIELDTTDDEETEDDGVGIVSMEELGQRAVASGKFRPSRGMQLLSGQLVLGVADPDEFSFLKEANVPLSVMVIDPFNQIDVIPQHSCIPDFTHPCTRGGLLALVMEALGEDEFSYVNQRFLFTWGCHDHVEALVAALEVAP